MAQALFLIGIALLVTSVYMMLGCILALVLLDDEDESFKRELPKFIVFWPILVVVYSVKSLFNKNN
jgi:hypothetical protein